MQMCITDKRVPPCQLPFDTINRELIQEFIIIHLSESEIIFLLSFKCMPENEAAFIVCRDVPDTEIRQSRIVFRLSEIQPADIQPVGLCGDKQRHSAHWTNVDLTFNPRSENLGEHIKII